jgi:hypothetical protein
VYKEVDSYLNSLTCKIWDSHCDGYEEFCLLGYKAVHFCESQQTASRALLADCFMLLSCLTYPSTWRSKRHTSPRWRLTFPSLYSTSRSQNSSIGELSYMSTVLYYCAIQFCKSFCASLSKPAARDLYLAGSEVVSWVRVRNKTLSF